MGVLGLIAHQEVRQVNAGRPGGGSDRPHLVAIMLEDLLDLTLDEPQRTKDHNTSRTALALSA